MLVRELVKEERKSDGIATRGHKSVIVACPDARPPAYQAVIGLNRAGRLDRFVTSSLLRPRRATGHAGPAPGPARFAQWEKVLLRRHDPEIPADAFGPCLVSTWSCRLEARVAGRLADAETHCWRRCAQIGSTGGWPGSWRIVAPRRSCSSATSARE